MSEGKRWEIVSVIISTPEEARTTEDAVKDEAEAATSLKNKVSLISVNTVTMHAIK